MSFELDTKVKQYFISGKSDCSLNQRTEQRMGMNFSLKLGLCSSNNQECLERIISWGLTVKD